MLRKIINKKPEKGFTLIELMIVIFVLVVGLLSVLVIFPIGIKIEKDSQNRTIGSQLCQEKIEKLIAQPYDESQLNIGTTTENYGTISGFDSFKRITRINYYNPQSQSLSDIDLGIKKIEVEIFWRSSLRSAEEEINIQSFISKK